MKHITDLVCENLIKLRKQHGLTQLELSSKISYSDKAISRWEKGEVTPSIEVLEKLSEIYDVPCTYFFEHHPDEETKKLTRRTKNLYIAILLSLIFFVWTISVILFFSLKRLVGSYYIMTMVWAIPVTCYLCNFALNKWFNKRFFILTASFSFWTTVLAIYFQWLSYNIWQIFFLGIPAQILIVLVHIVRKLKLFSLKEKKK